MQTILTITDWVLFALLGFATAYLFIFALASMRRRRDRFPAARIACGGTEKGSKTRKEFHQKNK